MLPILFTLGPFTLHTYGLLTALGMAVAVTLAWRRAPAIGLPRDKLLDLSFWIIIGGIIGARALYVVVTWREFAQDPWTMFKIWQGGLVWYGGFAAAVLSGWIYLKRQKLPVGRTFDLAAPYIPLAHVFGRLGCFANGCCYGRPSRAFGLVFPSLGDNLPHLPTQLIEAAFNLGLVAVLLRLRRDPGRPPGQLFWWYVGLYAAGRFLLEFLRGDEIRGSIFFPWLHTSQLIALLALGLACVFLFAANQRASRV